MDMQKSSKTSDPSVIFTKNVAIYSHLVVHIIHCYLAWRQARHQNTNKLEDAASAKARSWQIHSSLLVYLACIETVVLGGVPWLWHFVEAYQTQYLPSYGSEFWRSSLFLMACALAYMTFDGISSGLRKWILKGETTVNARPIWRWTNVWTSVVDGQPVPAVILIFCFNTLVMKAFGLRLHGIPYFVLTAIEVYVPFLLYPVYLHSRIQRAATVESEELRSSIEGAAAGFKFPLKEIHVVTGPLESLDKGVQLIGYPKKHSIGIHEALLSSLSNNEITGLVGSKLGDWKRYVSIIVYGFSVILFGNMFTFVTLFITERSSYESFGFKDEYPMVAGIVLFGLAMAIPFATMFGIQRNAMAYANTFVPDKLAADNGYLIELQAALGKIAELQAERWSSSGDWLNALYYNGEPTIAARLQKLEKMATERALKNEAAVEKKENVDIV